MNNSKLSNLMDKNASFDTGDKASAAKTVKTDGENQQPMKRKSNNKRASMHKRPSRPRKSLRGNSNQAMLLAQHRRNRSTNFRQRLEELTGSRWMPHGVYNNQKAYIKSVQAYCAKVRPQYRKDQQTIHFLFALMSALYPTSTHCRALAKASEALPKEPYACPVGDVARLALLLDLLLRGNYGQDGETANAVYDTCRCQGGFANEDFLRLRDSGNSLWQRQDITGALSSWEQAVALVPDSVAMHYNMAAGYIALKDYPRAKQSAWLALEEGKSEVPRYWSRYGWALVGLKEWNDAFNAFQFALKYDPGLEDASRGLATVKDKVNLPDVQEGNEDKEEEAGPSSPVASSKSGLTPDATLSPRTRMALPGAGDKKTFGLPTSTLRKASVILGGAFGGPSSSNRGRPTTGTQNLSGIPDGAAGSPDKSQVRSGVKADQTCVALVVWAFLDCHGPEFLWKRITPSYTHASFTDRTLQRELMLIHELCLRVLWEVELFLRLNPTCASRHPRFVALSSGGQKAGSGGEVDFAGFGDDAGAGVKRSSSTTAWWYHDVIYPTLEHLSKSGFNRADLACIFAFLLGRRNVRLQPFLPAHLHTEQRTNAERFGEELPLGDQELHVIGAFQETSLIPSVLRAMARCSASVQSDSLIYCQLLAPVFPNTESLFASPRWFQDWVALITGSNECLPDAEPDWENSPKMAFASLRRPPNLVMVVNLLSMCFAARVVSEEVPAHLASSGGGGSMEVGGDPGGGHAIVPAVRKEVFKFISDAWGELEQLTGWTNNCVGVVLVVLTSLLHRLARARLSRVLLPDLANPVWGSVLGVLDAIENYMFFSPVVEVKRAPARRFWSEFGLHVNEFGRPSDKELVSKTLDLLKGLQVQQLAKAQYENAELAAAAAKLERVFAKEVEFYSLVQDYFQHFNTADAAQKQSYIERLARELSDRRVSALRRLGRSLEALGLYTGNKQLRRKQLLKGFEQAHGTADQMANLPTVQLIAAAARRVQPQPQPGENLTSTSAPAAVVAKNESDSTGGAVGGPGGAASGGQGVAVGGEKNTNFNLRNELENAKRVKRRESLVGGGPAQARPMRKTSGRRGGVFSIIPAENRGKPTDEESLDNNSLSLSRSGRNRGESDGSEGGHSDASEEMREEGEHSSPAKKMGVRERANRAFTSLRAGTGTHGPSALATPGGGANGPDHSGVGGSSSLKSLFGRGSMFSGKKPSGKEGDSGSSSPLVSSAFSQNSKASESPKSETRSAQDSLSKERTLSNEGPIIEEEEQPLPPTLPNALDKDQEYPLPETPLLPPPVDSSPSPALPASPTISIFPPFISPPRDSQDSSVGQLESFPSPPATASSPCWDIPPPPEGDMSTSPQMPHRDTTASMRLTTPVARDTRLSDVAPPSIHESVWEIRTSADVAPPMIRESVWDPTSGSPQIPTTTARRLVIPGRETASPGLRPRLKSLIMGDDADVPPPPLSTTRDLALGTNGVGHQRFDLWEEAPPPPPESEEAEGEQAHADGHNTQDGDELQDVMEGDEDIEEDDEDIEEDDEDEEGEEGDEGDMDQPSMAEDMMIPPPPDVMPRISELSDSSSDEEEGGDIEPLDNLHKLFSKEKFHRRLVSNVFTSMNDGTKSPILPSLIVDKNAVSKGDAPLSKSQRQQVMEEAAMVALLDREDEHRKATATPEKIPSPPARSTSGLWLENTSSGDEQGPSTHSARGPKPALPAYPTTGGVAAIVGGTLAREKTTAQSQQSMMYALQAQLDDLAYSALPCVTCDRMLLPEDQFEDHAGEVYCEEDFVRLLCACRGCDQPLSDDVQVTKLLVDGETWLFHLEHFVCFACKTSLAKRTHVAEQRRLFCEADYFRLFGQICVGCGQSIHLESLEVQGATYHPDCFTCFGCSKVLSDAAESAYSMVTCSNQRLQALAGRLGKRLPTHAEQGKERKQDNKEAEAEAPICRECYIRDIQLIRCHGCREEVQAGKMTMDELGRPFHAKCLCCAVEGCNRLKGLKLLEGKRYCTVHFKEKTNRCCSCHHPILRNGLVLREKQYHPECLKCTECHTTLATNGIYFKAAVDGKEVMVCYDHYAVSKAKHHCTACKKPLLQGGRLLAGHTYHDSCVTCYVCQKILPQVLMGPANAPDLNLRGKFFCSEHFTAKFPNVAIA